MVTIYSKAGLVCQCFLAPPKEAKITAPDVNRENGILTFSNAEGPAAPRYLCSAKRISLQRGISIMSRISVIPGSEAKRNVTRNPV
jgi:hypothetical protein